MSLVQLAKSWLWNGSDTRHENPVIARHMKQFITWFLAVGGDATDLPNGLFGSPVGVKEWRGVGSRLLVVYVCLRSHSFTTLEGEGEGRRGGGGGGEVR